jgi:GDP/UDP-N,N'-diacetylbacillosamine 2-epimerase (hydrolysing)
MRRVCYISGSRADFGLLERTLALARSDSRLDPSVCVTGQHLCAAYGDTVRDIEASGLRICARVPVALDGSGGATMARAIGRELIGIVDALEAEKPEVVLVLGDRGEMLAGALAAIHLNIPVVHLHGGERSGTVDEPVRHAISKLAHYHFVSTQGARERLVRMGERAECIFVTGAPGLDGLREEAARSRADLCRELGFDARRPVALVVIHPVVQEAAQGGGHAAMVLEAVLGAGCQALCLTPNSDAGGQQIRGALARYEEQRDVRIRTHLPRRDFASWLAAADVMVGNSSSGIIEAAAFGLPVVNVGDRQRERERSANVIDVQIEARAIGAAIEHALAAGKREVANVYGDGQASQRIVELLAGVPLDAALLRKSNAY